MKTSVIIAFTGLSILLSGCGKKDGPSAGAPSSKTESAPATPSSTPVVEAALTAWESGNKPAAMKSFLEANWSARPIFAPGSTLSLSEDQFKSLSAGDREARSGGMLARLDSLKKLAAAVMQAGKEAAARGDAAEARKSFTSVRECGTALDSPDCLQIVRLVGRAMKKMAAAELGSP